MNSNAFQLSDVHIVQSRRQWLRHSAAATLGGLVSLHAAQTDVVAADVVAADAVAAEAGEAKVAITLDLEMSRNFPTWESRHWDYEKGNLNSETKRYAVEAARRVKAAGGVLHFFAVGRMLEQENVDWAKELVREGHPIGNHTYDHVNVTAANREALQFRFQRAPWLLGDLTTHDAIRANIRLCDIALQQRLAIQSRGFRTPGGFHQGLREHPQIRTMLRDLGFTWVSSLYPSHPYTKPMQEPTAEILDGIVDAHQSAQPFVYPDGLVEIPMSPISDIGAFRTGRWELQWYLDAIRRVVEWTIENGAVFDFLAHPSCLYVSDPKFEAIDLICELVSSAGDRASIVDLDTIARSVDRRVEN